jgi:hypothetical protein
MFFLIFIWSSNLSFSIINNFRAEIIIMNNIEMKMFYKQKFKFFV